jgi:GTP-binding protein HflX
VFGEIDALDVPEQLVFNKVDAATPEMLLRLRGLAPDALFVSARTGAGIDELQVLIEQQLPRPEIEITVLVPYTRGDLVTRLHDEADVLDTEHTAGGTLLQARVGAALAEQLRPFTHAVG